MNRSIVVFFLFVLSVMIGAATLRVRAQGPGGNSPEAQAARQKQLALEAACLWRIADSSLNSAFSAPGKIWNARSHPPNCPRSLNARSSCGYCRCKVRDR